LHLPFFITSPGAPGAANPTRLERTRDHRAFVPDARVHLVGVASKKFRLKAKVLSTNTVRNKKKRGNFAYPFL